MPVDQIVTYRDFLSRPSRDRALVLIDINTVPVHMRSDYRTRNAHVQAGTPLCARCDGTGNELFSMYRRCPDCQGSGKGQEAPSHHG